MNNLEAFKPFVEFSDWVQIWPELALAIGAVVLLGVELFCNPGHGKRSPAGTLAILFQAGLLLFHLNDFLVWHSYNYFERDTFAGTRSKPSQHAAPGSRRPR